eukprot:UC4_evm1s445
MPALGPEAEQRLRTTQIVQDPLQYIDAAWQTTFSQSASSPTTTSQLLEIAFADIDRAALVAACPSLNDTPSYLLRPGTLVRYRAMVQDSFDPEYFCEVLPEHRQTEGNGNSPPSVETRLRFGRFRDSLPASNPSEGWTAIDDQSQCISPHSQQQQQLSSRQPLYCVPIPGESSWAKSAFAVRSLEACTAARQHLNGTATESSSAREQSFGKRTLEDMALDEDESQLHDQDRPCDPGSTSLSAPQTLSSSDPSSISSPPSSSSGPSSFNLNCPLGDAENGATALVKIYDHNQHIFKINEMVEFLGVLEINPAHAIHHETNNGSVENMNDAAQYAATSVFCDEERHAHEPPPSLVPRLHVLDYTRLKHSNPIVAQDIDESAKSRVRTAAPAARAALKAICCEMLGGDDVAAEYLILHLLSEVYKRFPDNTFVLGKFGLNILGVTPGSGLPSQIANLVSTLRPKSVFFPMTVDNLNKHSFIPRKNYETNRLDTGIAQLSNGTHLILDETALLPGTLEGKGLKNLKCIAKILTHQAVDFDFTYNEITFHSDIPTLIFSEGKSMLPVDVRVPLVANPSAGAAPVLSEELVGDLRIYLEVVHHLDYNIDPEIQNVVEKDFVTMRQEAPKEIDDEHLHRLLGAARLLTLSHGLTSLTSDLWAEAKALDLAARKRITSGARNRARVYNNKSVHVELDDGYYSMSEPLLLDPEDSERIFYASPGAKPILSAGIQVKGFRKAEPHDIAWNTLSSDARQHVMIAPLPSGVREIPRTLFDLAAEAANPTDLAVRTLRNTNIIYSLVPEPRKDSEVCRYLGQFDDEISCQDAALASEGLWGYSWHDPSAIAAPWGSGCYGRFDVHGSRKFQSQIGIQSGVFSSTQWRAVAESDISGYVTTKHICEGAECEGLDSAYNKSMMKMNMNRSHYQAIVGNSAKDLLIRIYLVDFAMNVLPVANYSQDGLQTVIRTGYPGTFRLGKDPGYCHQEYNEEKCTPSVWLLNTFNFFRPGEFAISMEENSVYYWPALKTSDVSSVYLPGAASIVNIQGAPGAPVSNIEFVDISFRHGYEAIGIFGLGLGITQVTSNNTVAGNNISETGLIKIDSPRLVNLHCDIKLVTVCLLYIPFDLLILKTPFRKNSIVIWNAKYNTIEENLIHGTSARALYLGGSRYCSEIKPPLFTTDGGVRMNNWNELMDSNVPLLWKTLCENNDYAYEFKEDCKWEGAPSFRMLYVDGYTGSMSITRNAIVGANARQGLMLCNWYGHSLVKANALQLGESSWGNLYEISINCDGNPVLTSEGNLVLSDQTSPSHQPAISNLEDYEAVFDNKRWPARTDMSIMTKKQGEADKPRSEKDGRLH